MYICYMHNFGQKTWWEISMRIFSHKFLLLFPQFHTCVITENVVSFPRSELDVACEDPRCPPDSVVTLYFATDMKRQDGPVPAPTPAVPHASAHHDPILHWDSYTNLEISDDGKSQIFIRFLFECDNKKIHLFI